MLEVFFYSDVTIKVSSSIQLDLTLSFWFLCLSMSTFSLTIYQLKYTIVSHTIFLPLVQIFNVITAAIFDT